MMLDSSNCRPDGQCSPPHCADAGPVDIWRPQRPHIPRSHLALRLRRSHPLTSSPPLTHHLRPIRMRLHALLLLFALGVTASPAPAPIPDADAAADTDVAAREASTPAFRKTCRINCFREPCPRPPPWCCELPPLGPPIHALSPLQVSGPFRALRLLHSPVLLGFPCPSHTRLIPISSSPLVFSTPATGATPSLFLSGCARCPAPHLSSSRHLTLP